MQAAASVGNAGQAVLGMPRRWPRRLGADEELLALLEMATHGPAGQASRAVDESRSVQAV